MASALEAALDELFLVPPEQFVDTRKALAAKLGKGPDAKAVLEQKKPTRVAHLLNRLARDHAGDVAGLASIAERLSAAHHAGKSEALREVINEQRQAVNALSAKASVLLGELGVAQSELTAINALLYAATASTERAAELKQGRFSKLPETTDFFGGGGLAVAPPTVPAVAAEPAAKGAGEPEPDPAAVEAEKRRVLAEQRARAAAETAEREAIRAQEAAAVIEREVRVLDEAAHVAAAAATAAQLVLTRATERFEQAKAEASQRVKEAAALRVEAEKLRG